MIVHRPLALLALLLVPVLIWLSRRRTRPRHVVWPSLRLWEGLDATAAGSPRRAVDRLLWAECLAVALLALAAAGLEIDAGPAPLRVRILWDEGRHMEARLADGRTAREATAAEIDRVKSALPSAEFVRGTLPESVPLRGDEDWTILATYREAPVGTDQTVIGVAPDRGNAGIDAVAVRGDKIWYTVVDADGATTEHERAWSESIVLQREDSYAGDNRVSLRRFALRVAAPDSRVVRAAVGAGTAARIVPSDAELTIVHEPGTERVRGAECVAQGIAAGLYWGDIVWSNVASTEAFARPLLSWKGRVIAAWRDDTTLWLGMPVDEDWDNHGTLALLLERAKRARLGQVLADDEAYVGGAIAKPSPGRLDVSGRTKLWDGNHPEPERRRAGRTALQTGLALAAAVVLAVYVFWLWSSRNSTVR